MADFSKLKNARVLITGGSGFIGSHLTEELLRLGAKVTIVDDMTTGYASNLEAVRDQIEVIIGEIGQLLRFKRVNVADYDYLFHLAGNPYIPPSVENPDFDMYENFQTTFLLLEAMRAVGKENAPRIIYSSSAAVYGNPIHLPTAESDPTVPISPYGVSKLASERYIDVFSKIYGLAGVTVRFFSVYGPRQRKQVVFDLLRKLRANPDRLEIIGDGSQVRDFAFVTDVVQALLLAAAVAPGNGEVYNVASDISHSIKELALTWAEVCGLNPEIVYTGSVRPGDAEKWEVDLTSIRELGFEPKVNLKAGLIAIRDWYDATFSA